MATLRRTTDGIVTIRAPEPGDAELLVAGRDTEFHRFLGPGAARPEPVGCVEIDGSVVGWVDYDLADAHDWLGPSEVNVGYALFPAHRGRGYASRAVQLLLHHLAVDTDQRTATLVIHPDNARSLTLAERLRFARTSDLGANRVFTRPVPPLTYTDGAVTIRPQRPSDLDIDLAAKDDEQMHRMWLPAERAAWAAMSTEDRRRHALQGLQTNAASFGQGPTWTFAVDSRDHVYVAYVDFDLANEHIPAGEANISYSSHPDHRGRSHVSRAVRLVTQFLRDHTATCRAHIVIDKENAASLRVAAAVGAEPAERWSTTQGRTMIRHIIDLH